MAPVVEFVDVAFGYRTRPLLQGVDIRIESGQFVGIIGPNGSGKTTLLKLIMGFLEPTLGTIRVFGKSPGKATKPMAYVPQTLRFDRKFPISVMELVLAGRLSHLPWYGRYGQDDKQAAIEALEQVGIPHLKGKAIGTLSGGEVQRALIARALVTDPQLLLLDEPTANLDTQAEGDIYRLLDGLRQSITILMVTHNLRTAIEHVEQVLCVEKRVMAFKPQEVCEHFAVGLYHPPLMEE